MFEQLVIKTRIDGSNAVLQLRGEIDIASAPQLASELDQLPPATSILLDLSAVEFIDSSGIGMLMDTHRRLVEHGGQLRLEGAAGITRRALELTGVLDLLQA